MLVVLERLLGRDQQPDRREKLGVSFDLGATAELNSDSTGSTDAALVLRGARGRGEPLAGKTVENANHSEAGLIEASEARRERARPADEARLAACKTLES